MPINISVKLEPAYAMQERLNEYVLFKLIAIINTEDVTRIIQKYFTEAVMAHPTWNALLNGRQAGIDDLRADFGIRKGTEQSRLNTLLEAMSNSIVTKIKPRLFKKSLRVRLPVYGVDADFKGVKELPAGITINKGETLPWFEWLVLAGDAEVVDGYTILYSKKFQGSRSGYAVMMVQPRKSFKVNPDFQGTRSNNFVTQAIANIQNNTAMFKELEDLVISWVDKIK